ncbi:MAG TPA: amino acid ABC transporter ATP-binding protein, partial [Trinickia sp.]|nr:amino acid ABC transporter ATP-binding protein [Trinickia sp.]
MNAMTDLVSSSPSGAASASPRLSALVEVRELRKRFGDVEVLRGVDLEIAKSEVVCIIGPSGSG